ncbi:hypothetical protein Q1695_002133 [Nippostrongylus brasiliensis]|nr:hypothetical protein Q1695_002133 [Nippostrongylus brasiliensis]
MKFTESILSMVGDFAAMKRTPDYNPAAAITDDAEVEKPPKDAKPNNASLRKHSLIISVGTEEIPKLRRNRSESMSCTMPGIEAKLYNKANRRVSAPCISTAPSSLRKKLQKLRNEKDSDSDDTLKEEDEEGYASPHRRISSVSAVYQM